MIEFYFKGLTYPRLTVSDIINLCEKNGMNVKSVIYENNIYKNEIKKYVLHVKILRCKDIQAYQKRNI